MPAFRESVESAVKDTGMVLVQPTTLGRVFGQKPQRVSARTLREKVDR